MSSQKLISINDLFNKSFGFYKNRLYTILTLACIPFANFVVMSLLYELIGKPADKMNFPVGLWLIIFLFSIFALVVNLWVQIAYFYVIKKKNVKTDAKSLLTSSWSKLFPYSWVLFLVGIICVAGFILLVVPGIIFTIWFGLALYVFVFEDMQGMDALYRSRALVKGYWWPVFGRLLLFGFLAGVVSWIPVIGSIINIFLLMPLGVMYGYFIYDNLKSIKA